MTADDPILRLYDSYKSGNEQALPELQSRLDEIVESLSVEAVPANSPEYAEIAHELGMEGQREAFDRIFRELWRRSVRRRRSRRPKRAPEESLRQYILARIEQGVLGEPLTAAVTEVDTSTGRVDIYATDANGARVLVELKGEDWDGSREHYSLVGQVNTYFNELNVKTDEARAIIVVPEFPQRVYNGLRHHIQEGRISALTFTPGGVSFSFSPVDFSSFEEHLRAASEVSFERPPEWFAGLEKGRAQLKPDTFSISDLVPKGRKARKRKGARSRQSEASELRSLLDSLSSQTAEPDEATRLRVQECWQRLMMERDKHVARKNSFYQFLDKLSGLRVEEEVLNRVLSIHTDPERVILQAVEHSYMPKQEERGFILNLNNLEQLGIADFTMEYVEHHSRRDKKEGEKHAVIPGLITRLSEGGIPLEEVLLKIEDIDARQDEQDRQVESTAKGIINRLEGRQCTAEEKTLLRYARHFARLSSWIESKQHKLVLKDIALQVSALRDVDPCLAELYAHEALRGRWVLEIPLFSMIQSKLRPQGDVPALEERVESWQGAPVSASDLGTLRCRLRKAVELLRRYREFEESVIEPAQGKTYGLLPNKLQWLSENGKHVPDFPLNEEEIKMVFEREYEVRDASGRAHLLDRSCDVELLEEQARKGMRHFRKTARELRQCLKKISRYNQEYEKLRYSEHLTAEEVQSVREYNARLERVLCAKYAAHFKLAIAASELYRMVEAAAPELVQGWREHYSVTDVIRVAEGIVGKLYVESTKKPEAQTSEPRTKAEHVESFDAPKYMDSVHLSICNGTIPPYIQESSIDFAILAAETKNLTEEQKRELLERLNHFDNEKPINRTLESRMPTRKQFRKFVEAISHSVRQGQVPDVRQLYSTMCC